MMPREAELADGTVLEFPDETTDAVMQTAVKRYISMQKVGTAASTEPTPESRRRAFMDLERRANAGDPAAVEERRQRERGLEMQMRATEPGAAGTALAATAAIPLVGGLVTAPVATGKALLGAMVGSAAGKAGGQWVGQHLPLIGGPTAAEVMGDIGAVMGGGVGAAKASTFSAGRLLNMATGGRLGTILSEGEAAVASPVSEVAKQRLANDAERIALRRRAMDLAERRLALAEGRAGAKAAVGQPTAAPTSAPPTEGATALAPEATETRADEIAGKILQWKNENKFSGAQMESALRNVYGIKPTDGRKMIAAVLESQETSPLQAPRIQVGAQKVGRQVGMTKEEVRQVAGPVLNEERGEASPILPQQALNSIIDKMKSLPKTGGYREAYVAAATSGKTMAQVENVRRTLERLGLLLPVGATAGLAASEER